MFPSLNLSLAFLSNLPELNLLLAEGGRRGRRRSFGKLMAGGRRCVRVGRELACRSGLNESCHLLNWCKYWQKGRTSCTVVLIERGADRVLPQAAVVAVRDWRYRFVRVAVECQLAFWMEPDGVVRAELFVRCCS